MNATDLNTDIIVRDATINDLPKIVEIYNSTIPSRMVTADIEPVSVEDRKPWFEKHTANSRPIWMVEYKGQSCAWISLEAFYGRPAYNATAEVSIYIDEAYRGKGLGTFMLQKVIEESPKLQIKTLLGFIFGHNKPSLNLFYKFGFENWALLPSVAELDGIERDLVIVGKKLHSS